MPTGRVGVDRPAHGLEPGRWFLFMDESDDQELINFALSADPSQLRKDQRQIIVSAFLRQELRKQKAELKAKMFYVRMKLVAEGNPFIL